MVVVIKTILRLFNKLFIEFLTTLNIHMLKKKTVNFIIILIHLNQNLKHKLLKLKKCMETENHKTKTYIVEKTLYTKIITN